MERLIARTGSLPSDSLSGGPEADSQSEIPPLRCAQVRNDSMGGSVRNDIQGALVGMTRP
jgi:hypothetical protein